MLEKEDLIRLSNSLERVTVGLDSLTKATERSYESITKILDKHDMEHNEHKHAIHKNSLDIESLKTLKNTVYAFGSFLGVGVIISTLKGIINH